MSELTDFVRLRCVYATAQVEAHLATRKSDAAQVVLRVHKQSGAFERIAREIELLTSLAAPDVPQLVDWNDHESPPWLQLAPAPGCVLGERLASGVLPCEDALELTRHLARSLGRLHARGFVYNVLSPGTVWLDRRSSSTQLISFEALVRIGSPDTVGAGRPSVDLLRYASPERTGRMGRSVDHRSDLYSIGALLYHVLTGRPPFVSNDPLALIHSHMARLPEAPHVVRSDVPKQVARIVERLLQKEPEARYASADELLNDLDHCSQQLARGSVLGHDLELPSDTGLARALRAHGLIGRDAEARTLREGFERARSGRLTCLTVSGPPGIGKSSLVRSLRVPVSDADGYLIQTSFDANRCDAPYAGFAQLLERLAAQLLAEPDERLERVRDAISRALGSLAPALIPLASELEHVLPVHAPLPPLGPAETQSRLSLALQRFLCAIATPERPIALWLDSLQWADAASRRLLRDLVLEYPEAPILIVATYEEPASLQATPQRRSDLTRLLESLQTGTRVVQTISLQALSESSCASLLAETLELPLERVTLLARVLARKAGRIPLVFRNLLLSLHEHGLLRRDADQSWSWDLDAVEQFALPDDSATLLGRQVAQLPSELADVLALAAIVGVSFELTTLMLIVDLPQDELRRRLLGLCSEGHLIPERSGFRFVHARIRESALARLGDDERSRVHADLARRLLAQTPQPPDESLFEITDHLNAGAGHLAREEHWLHVELNLRAGRAALAAGAAATAAKYFEIARARFDEAHWNAHPDEGARLLLGSAEARVQQGELQAARELLDELASRPLPSLARAELEAKRIQIAIVDGTPRSQLVPVVRRVLAAFDVHLPLAPSRLRTCLTIWRTDAWLRSHLGDDGFERFRPRPGSDPLPAMVLLGIAASVLGASSPRYSCWATARLLARFRRHGFPQTPAATLAGYAAYRRAVLGHNRGADQIATAALAWSERAPHPLQTPRTRFVVTNFIGGWTRERRKVTRDLERLVTEFCEVGDVQYRHYATSYHAFYLSLTGAPLAEVEASLRALAGMSDHPGTRLVRFYSQACGYLSRSIPEPGSLRSECSRFLAALHADVVGQHTGSWAFWAGTLCHLGAHDELLELSTRISDWVDDRGHMTSFAADFRFFEGIAAGALVTSSRQPRRGLRRILRRAHRCLRTWSTDGCPDFAHMSGGLEAEVLRLRGRATAALERYDAAAESAESLGYPDRAALLIQRACSLPQVRSDAIESSRRSLRVSELYRAWGASALAEHMSSRRRPSRR